MVKKVNVAASTGYGNRVGSAAPSGGGLLGNLPPEILQGLIGQNDWRSSIGPMLLNLGAGIAGGANQGWGPGIGQGLALAGQAQQNSRNDKLKQFALLQSLLNAKATNDYRNQTLGLRQREAESNDAYRRARIKNLQNPQDKIGATVEGIRAKLARGETLTPGESKVYEDMLKQDFVTRLLMGQVVPQAAPQSKSPVSTGPQSFEASPARRQLGQVYNLPDGRQGLWTKDASGKVGWEVLN
jgi:hypothetical protein